MNDAVANEIYTAMIYRRGLINGLLCAVLIYLIYSMLMEMTYPRRGTFYHVPPIPPAPAKETPEQEGETVQDMKP